MRHSFIRCDVWIRGLLLRITTSLFPLKIENEENDICNFKESCFLNYQEKDTIGSLEKDYIFIAKKPEEK